MIIGNKYLRRFYDQKKGLVCDRKNACLFVINPKSRWTAWAAEFLLAESQAHSTCWIPGQSEISFDKTLYRQAFAPVIFDDNKVIW